ncbi:hypothetical protein CB1_000940012 [Camelus ferus]|nr:hypothetical protein CB1_000940012 [Camelus ferus]
MELKKTFNVLYPPCPDYTGNSRCRKLKPASMVDSCFVSQGLTALAAFLLFPFDSLAASQIEVSRMVHGSMLENVSDQMYWIKQNSSLEAAIRTTGRFWKEHLLYAAPHTGFYEGVEQKLLMLRMIGFQ